MTTHEISALWDFGDAAASERRFREALGSENDAQVRLELKTQIARALGLQRDFDGGHAMLDEAATCGEALNFRSMALMLLERGRLFNSAGDREPAVQLFERAFDQAITGDENALAIDAAHMLGIAAPAELQLDWNERALAMAEAATDERSRAWQGPLLNNIGWTYHDRGDFAIALDHFERGAIWRRKKGGQTEIRIADWSVARTLRSLNRLGEALTIQMRLAAEWEAAGEVDPYVDEELAECLHALGRFDEARPHFKTAYERLSADSWIAENEVTRLNRLKILGQLADA